MPIVAYRVFIDDKEVKDSFTDSRAMIRLLTTKETFDLKIEKSSSDFYYSTYYQRLKMSEEAIEITAILYKVPKIDDIVLETAKKPPIEMLETNIYEDKAIDLVNSREDIFWPDGLLLSTYQKKAKLSGNESKKHTFRIYSSGKKLLQGAEIFLAKGRNQPYLSVGVSNENGHIVVAIDSKEEEIFLLCRFPGHLTQLQKFKPDRFIHSIVLVKGISLDIETLWQFERKNLPLHNVKVFMDGKIVGKTNEQGIFSLPIHKGLEELVTISLQKNGFFPEFYETDVHVSRTMIVQKLFVDQNQKYGGVVLANHKGFLEILFASATKLGDKIDIIGTQISETGEKREILPIAEAKVTRIDGSKARAEILAQKPRSLIARGDFAEVNAFSELPKKDEEMNVSVLDLALSELVVAQKIELKKPSLALDSYHQAAILFDEVLEKSFVLDNEKLEVLFYAGFVADSIYRLDASSNNLEIARKKWRKFAQESRYKGRLSRISDKNTNL